MRHFTIFIILVLFCGHYSAMAGGKQTTKLRLLSYNIRYINAPGDEGLLAWDARKSYSIKMIRTEKPDVIGFQEPRGPQLGYLADQLPEYAHVEMGRDSGVKEDGGEHLMVMWLKSKYILLDSGHYWLSDTPQKVSCGWDAACRRVTVWICLRDRVTGAKFYYFNTHLDHKGNNARMEGAKLNVAMMKQIAGGKAPVIISGDMNSDPDKPTGINLKPYNGWMCSARDTASESDSIPSFHGFGKCAPLWIDHVFYRNLTVVKYSTLQSNVYGIDYLSDHNPQLCEFIIK